MRSSFAIAPLALGLVVLSACSVSTTGNSITFKTQPEFLDNSQPAKTTTKAWAGEEIVIKNSGVNPMVGTGGLTINVDPSATTISAKADFVARADEEAEAKLSIADAIKTFSIEESSGRIAINCGNGGAHGSSSAAASGCKRITITIPAGSETQPHKLTLSTGMGDIKFSGAPTVANLLVDDNGTGGEVDVGAIPVKGARIVVTGEDNVTVRLPADFAADNVVLSYGIDTSATDEQNRARVITTDFPGMETNKPYGQVGTGAAELNVQTKGKTATPPSLAETVTIRKL